jgi:2-methylcitrate dehydratase PrpD
MSGPTRILAEFAAALSYDDLPPEVARRAKLLIFDTIGIALRARYDAESTHSLINAVNRLGMIGDSASVIGDTNRYTAAGAALINGALAHSLDFDDTHARGSLHCSAPIMPAALAAAEEANATGAQAIAAIVAGYEVQIRLSLALGPSDHYGRGFHPTATCGAFGAAAAVGNIMDLTADQMESAFGICLSMAAGSMQFLADGAWTKRSHVGHAAMCGLIAATLAAEGYRGPTEAFEGSAGFLVSHAPNPDPAKASAGIGELWETMEIAVKPYPSCRYGHAAIDGLIALRKEHDLRPEDIEHVEVGLSRTGLNIIAAPLTEKQQPESVVDGQFSLPFVTAAALINGGLGWGDYKPLLASDEAKALWPKIEGAVHPKAEAAFPANMAANVKVTTTERTYETFVAVPKGEPDNFMTEDELRTKFESLVAPYLDAAELKAFADGLLSLEQADNIRALLNLSTSQPVMGAIAGGQT